MVNRLFVNAGTPQAWEIQLRPGLNRIGRGEHNDFVIPHPSVSGTHCEIVVSPAGIALKDLGSTNGTFIGSARISEVNLQSGQQLRFGQVDILFEGAAAAAPAPAPAPAIRIAAPATPAPTAPAPPTAAPAPAIRINKPGLNIARPAAPAAPVMVAESPQPMATPAVGHAHGGIPPRDMGTQFCRFHKTIHAHFHCDRCKKSFCDLCVNTKQDGEHLSHTCRACGNECVPLMVKRPKKAGRPGFFSSLPGAFIYPLKGTGILIIIVSGLIFAALEHFADPLFGIFILIVAFGYFFSYSQNIIHATAAEEKEMPDMPGFDDVFGGCFRLLVCVALSFGLPVAFAIANFAADAEIPLVLIISLTALGCLYFPMCFLAVAMKDTAVAANPLFVIPSILKVPLEYLVASIFFIGVLAMRLLGKGIAAGAGWASDTTRDMDVLFIALGFKVFWTFASVYLLTISMRVLGLLYLSKKHTLGWFPR